MAATSSVVVIGPGAIGGYFAGQLVAAGHRVTLGCRTPFDELQVESGGRVQTVPATVLTDPAACPVADWVLLATKVQQTEGAAPWLSAACGQQTRAVAVLQNGIDHRQRVGPLVGPTPVIPVAVRCGAEALRPGYIRHHGYSTMDVPTGSLSEEFARLFAGTDTSVQPSEDFERTIWLKLLQNVTASPITTLTGRRLDVMGLPPISELAAGLAREAVAVGRAAGVQLSEDDVTALQAAFATVNTEMGSSMLYDRLAGRPLEHEALTGAVVALGRRYGVSVPLNTAVAALLEAIDATER